MKRAKIRYRYRGIMDGNTLVRWRENFHENELPLAVSHNGYAAG